MNAVQIASALKAKKSGSGWIAKCPAHDDETPSLSISEVDGKVLVKCHAGCDQDAVIEKFREHGWWNGTDRSVPPDSHWKHGAPSAIYDYRDSSGQHVGRVMRFDREGGKKEISQCSLQGDSWTWKAMPAPRPLYRLASILKTDNTVLIVEGEKAVAAAAQIMTDMTVTTWAGGAKATDKADFSCLNGRNVILWPDNDGPGRDAVRSIAQCLQGVAASVRMFDPATLGKLPDGWDAADAMADKNCDLQAIWDGLTSAPELKSEFVKVAQLEPLKEPGKGVKSLAVTARHISDIIATPSRVRWLIRKELERGVIAVLAGKRGTFKSFIAQHWAMRAAITGETVLIVSAEGSGMDRRTLAYLKTHAPNVDTKGLPLYCIERRVDFNSAEGMRAVAEEVNRLQIRPALIVIDTLSKNSGGLDENDNSEVKEFIGRIDLGLRTPFDSTVLIVAHTGHGDQSRARGASAIEADTDACYIVSKPAEGMVSVTRERFKDAPELPPLNYVVEVVDLGYCDDYGDPVTSCALVPTEETPATRKPELKGKAQRQLLTAIQAAGDATKIWSLDELRRLGRTCGMTKGTARSAVEAITLSPYMVPTIGGYRLADA